MTKIDEVQCGVDRGIHSLHTLIDAEKLRGNKTEYLEEIIVLLNEYKRLAKAVNLNVLGRDNLRRTTVGDYTRKEWENNVNAAAKVLVQYF